MATMMAMALYAQGITELFDDARAELMKKLGDSLANRPLLLGDGQGGLAGMILPNGQVRSMAGGGDSDAVAAEVQQALAAAASVNSAVAASGPSIIDDFNRADSAVIGNGWTESGPGPWDIVSGRAVSTGGMFPPANSISKTIGNQATFDVAATFQYSNSLHSHYTLFVNSTGTVGGISVAYRNDVDLTVTGPSGSSVVPITTVSIGSDFTLRLIYDGVTATGSITNPLVNGMVSVATTNGAGADVTIEILKDGGPPATVQVDNVTGP